jgi:hypothetical protein
VISFKLNWVTCLVTLGEAYSKGYGFSTKVVVGILAQATRLISGRITGSLNRMDSKPLPLNLITVKIWLVI